MIWIYPEQLLVRLRKELKSIYVLFGNDSCVLQDMQCNIIEQAKKLNFYEHINIELNVNFDWNKIFNLCRIPDLLKQRKILSLQFPQDYPAVYFNKYISLLSAFIYEDILLILYIYKPSYIKKDSFCFQFLSKIGTFIICITPKHTQLTAWIMDQARYMKFSIENLACRLLCYYYEDNLILLKQILQILSLIYSDGNLSFERVKKIVTDSACFNSNHWIEAILLGNKQRANRILQRLEYIDVNLEILLQKIQHEIFILINIKYNLKPTMSLYTLLKQYKIYEKYHCILLSKAVQRLSIHQLYKSLALLVQIELRYKKDYNCLSKSSFELLTTILCYN